MAIQLSRIVPKRNPDTIGIHDRIIHACVVLILFLLPFFFIPSSTDALELNKSLLFFLLVFIGVVTWLLKIVLKREGSFRRTTYDIPLALFALFSIVAAVFSQYRFRSLVGTSGYYSHSLITTLFFIAFFLLLVNVLTRERLRSLLTAFLLSAGVVGVLNFFQVFGWFIFPWDVAKAASFNAVSVSPLTFSLYCAVVGLIGFLAFLAHPHATPRNRIVRSLLILLCLVMFFLLFVYDQNVGWYALILGLVLLLVFLN